MNGHAIQTPSCPVQEILVDEAREARTAGICCFESFHDEWKK